MTGHLVERIPPEIRGLSPIGEARAAALPSLRSAAAASRKKSEEQQRAAEASRKRRNPFIRK